MANPPHAMPAFPHPHSHSHSYYHPHSHRRRRRDAAAAEQKPLPSKKESAFAPLFRLVRDPAAALSGAWSAATQAHAEDEEDEEVRRWQLASARLENATSYREWEKAAAELDLLEGNEEWKREEESEDYDYELVKARLKQLDEVRLSCDIGKMLFLVRTTLSRNLGEMGSVRLYKHSHTGTKRLIEEYINSCLATFDTLLSLPLTAETPSAREILDSLINTRQSFGRTALLLSGGATFGMNHIGVLKALLEANLLPRIISGASAGSIVAAVLCTRTDDEIPNILQEFPYGNLDVFEDAKNPESILHRVARFLKIGAWIDIKHLTRVMRELLGDITFQEAYNRTRRILSICVSSASVYELPRLLNYISAPNVLIWSAVAASCSVPFLFSATSLLAKDPKSGLPVPWNPTPQRWIDGSVENDLPMTRLAEMFNVNHFIVSQVNPHVVPFLSKDPPTTALSPTTTATTWAQTALNLATGEALHRMNVLAELGIFKTALTKARSVLIQKYSGDITILPEIAYADFPRMLTNPTPGFMVTASRRGERATWPEIARVRNHCAIELALDMVIHRLRARVVFATDPAESVPSSASSSSSSWSAIAADRGFGAAANANTGVRGGVVPTATRGRRVRMRSHDPSAGLGWGGSNNNWDSGGGGGGGGGGRGRTGAVFRRVRRATSRELEPEDVGGESSLLKTTSGSSGSDEAGAAGYGWCLPDDDDEDAGDGQEVVANMGRRLLHRVPLPAGAVPGLGGKLGTGMGLGLGLSAPVSPVKRWGGVGRMTSAGEEVVVLGMGRAKSAEELRGMV